MHSRVDELHESLGRRYRGLAARDGDTLIGSFDINMAGGVCSLSSDRGEILRDRSVPHVLEALNYQLGLRFIEASPGFLWLHAGSVARNSQAVLFAASWGRGKSTLAVNLVHQGWRFLSDDLLPYDPAVLRVLPFPRAPAMRTHYDLEVPRERVGELRKLPFEFNGEHIATAATDPCAVIFPSFCFGGPDRYELCSPADAVVELLRNCINFLDHRVVAVEQLCRLLEEIPAFRLQFSSSASAVNMVSEIHASTERRSVAS